MRLMIRRKDGPVEEVAQDRVLPPSDIYFVFDGGKTGNHNEYMKPFIGRPKFHKNWCIYQDEESMRQRIGKSHGLAICQEEHLLAISANLPQVRHHYFTHFPGSLSGTMIDPVPMPAYNTVWRMQWKDRRALFGPNNMRLV